jgi:methanogenic corrinoid protein MtbC1
MHLNSTQSGVGELLSIGDLAIATGVSADTIRAWERRYGRPVAARLPSGHRRYTGEQVRWLRRIAEALVLGHRPSNVVKLSDGDLDKLLYPQPAQLDESDKLIKIIDLVRSFRGDLVVAELRKLFDSLGPDGFLKHALAPLLEMVGRAWADGELEIRHEHYLSQLLEDLLRTMRQSVPVSTDTRLVVLATLPGETHSLGLQIAAMMCALGGVRTQILGIDTPPQEIIRAVDEMKASGVAISVSLATGGVQTDRSIGQLREGLPARVRVAVGGQGARKPRRGPRGVDYVFDQSTLERWIEQLD